LGPIRYEVSDQPTKFTLIEGPKVVLFALVISPNKNKGIFLNREKRQSLKRKINKLRKKYNFSDTTKYFYPTFSPDTSMEQETYEDDGTFGSQIKGAVLSNNGDQYLDMIVEALGRDSKPKTLWLLSENPSSHKKIVEIENGTDYDFYISGVNIGGQITPAGINFMFCTKLGVSFPDPDGKICNLTQKYLNTENYDQQQFANEFQKVLDEDSWVIPISHEGVKRLVSDGIDPESVISFDTHPRFDLIRFKE